MLSIPMPLYNIKQHKYICVINIHVQNVGIHCSYTIIYAYVQNIKRRVQRRNLVLDLGKFLERYYNGQNQILQKKCSTVISINIIPFWLK